MDINALLLTLGLPGFFSTRAFTPAFVSALILRYGEHFPLLKEIDFLQTTGAEPMWFTSNWFILGMGLLSALELFATKSPAAEEMLGEVHKYAKTGMSFLTTMGIIGAGDIHYIGDLFKVQEAALMVNLWAAVVASATFIVTTLRNSVFTLLTEADPEDDIGIRHLISWFEDSWGAVGLLFLFLYPLLLLLVVGLFIAGLFGLRKYSEYREDRSKVSCESCAQPIYASAPYCPACDAPNAHPKAVGLLGQTKLKQAAPEPEFHALRLASKRRCPHCATRLAKRDTNQQCPACGHKPFASQHFRDAYTGMVSQRLFKTLSIAYLFGLIPVLGMIPGILYYRISLLSPYRAYLGAGQAFILRWLLRILFLFLISAQGVLPLAALVAAAPTAPFAFLLGATAVPVMAILSFSVYRLAFARRLSQTPEK